MIPRKIWKPMWYTGFTGYASSRVVSFFYVSFLLHLFLWTFPTNTERNLHHVNNPTSTITHSSFSLYANAQSDTEVLPPAGKNTTDFSHMQTIVGSDVGHELSDDEFIDEEIQFDWSIALNDTSIARPFLICVNNGREGVITLKQICEKGTFSNPVFSSSNVTCYILHETTEDLIQQMYMLPDLEFAIPFPGVLKQSKGLFWKIYSGCFFGETSNCDKGLRFNLSPGIALYLEQRLQFLAKVRAQVLSGDYKRIIAEEFFWIADTNSSTTTSPEAQQRRRKWYEMTEPERNGAPVPKGKTSDEIEDSNIEKYYTIGDENEEKKHDIQNNRQATIEEVQTTLAGGTIINRRGEKWLNMILPVLQGEITCDYSQIDFWGMKPDAGVKNLCSLHQPYLNDLGNQIRPPFGHGISCMLTLLAYFFALPEIVFIEPFPHVILPNPDEFADEISRSNINQKNELEAKDVRQIIIDDDEGEDSFDIGTTMDETNSVSWITQGNEESEFPLWNVGIDGTDQVVQIVDTGVDVNSCYFANDKATSDEVLTYSTWSNPIYNPNNRKVVEYIAYADTSDYDYGHGTHVAGIAIGSIAADSLDGTVEQGVAPNGKLSVYDIADSNGNFYMPSNLKNKIFTIGHSANAYVHSNSWGTTLHVYTTWDIQVDTFMYENPYSLLVFAAGNDGRDGTNTVVSPALSKNALTVGSTDNTVQAIDVSSYSSKGTPGDRIKPDLVAPGRKVKSAAAGLPCTNFKQSGTSMSTPVASANALLIRQYFMEGWYPSGYKQGKESIDSFTPSGALIKAMLINSATDMDYYIDGNGQRISLSSAPDVYQGFGRIKMTNVLDIHDSTTSLFVQDQVSISEGNIHTYKFTIPKDNINDFRVTLTWTDPPTSNGAANFVLHDLDLAITSDKLDGYVYFPNGRTDVDSINTVERIVVSNPLAHDTLTVTVTGTSILTTEFQNYALVVSGSFHKGAWFCQEPIASQRKDHARRSSSCHNDCELPNPKWNKNPKCCSITAGEICTIEEWETNPSPCGDFFEVTDCKGGTNPIVPRTSSPTPFPTPTPEPSPSPTSIPTSAPTTGSPTTSPTAPTAIPTFSPTAGPPSLYEIGSTAIEAGETVEYKFGIPKGISEWDFQVDIEVDGNDIDSIWLKVKDERKDEYVTGEIQTKASMKSTWNYGKPTGETNYIIEIISTSSLDQFFKLTVKGSFYSHVWYCQEPNPQERMDHKRRSSSCWNDCPTSGQTYNFNPQCCLPSAGEVCLVDEWERTLEKCGTFYLPNDCKGNSLYTSQPTSLPTPQPSPRPTSTPRPTSPTLPIDGPRSHYEILDIIIDGRMTLEYKFTIAEENENIDPFSFRLSSSSNSIVSYMTSDIEGVRYGDSITTPIPHDTISIYIENIGDISTTVSLNIDGSFYAGAWYCQQPNPEDRKDHKRRSASCHDSCPSNNPLENPYNKNPQCCAVTAGETCLVDEWIADSSLCGNFYEKFDCKDTPSPEDTSSPPSLYEESDTPISGEETVIYKLTIPSGNEWDLQINVVSENSQVTYSIISEKTGISYPKASGYMTLSDLESDDTLAISIENGAPSSTSFSFSAKGNFFTGAWYCQEVIPSNRKDHYRRSRSCFEDCQLPNPSYNKNPQCCTMDAGELCLVDEWQNSGNCGTFWEAKDCKSQRSVTLPIVGKERKTSLRRV